LAILAMRRIEKGPERDPLDIDPMNRHGMNDQKSFDFQNFLRAAAAARESLTLCWSLQLEDASAQAAVRLLMLCGGCGHDGRDLLGALAWLAQTACAALLTC